MKLVQVTIISLIFLFHYDLKAQCGGIVCPNTYVDGCSISEIPAFTDFAEFLNGGGFISGTCDLTASSFLLLNEVDLGTTCPMTFTRTYKITDVNEVDYSCTENITIFDSSPPVITVFPVDATFECDSNSENNADFWNSDNIDIILNNSFDECDYVTVVSDFSYFNLITNCGSTGNLNVEYTAIDNCGNYVTEQATLYIEDTIEPQISCPDKIVNETLAEIPSYMNVDQFVADGNTVFDHCGLDSFSFQMINETLVNSCPAQVIREYSIQDPCANFVSCVQTITYCEETSSLSYVSECTSYESPSGNFTWTESGVYYDTISNQECCDSLMTIFLTIEDNLVESPDDGMPNSLRLNLACAEFLDIINISPTIDTLFLENPLNITNDIIIKGDANK